MAKRPRLTVLGSLNMDISVTVPRLPAPGATVLGSAAVFTPGGKGANQAVAAARLGAEVRMTGCVGGDDFGRRLLTGRLGDLAARWFFDCDESLFKPVVGVGLFVECGYLTVAGSTVQADRLGQGAVGFQPQDADAVSRGVVL